MTESQRPTRAPAPVVAPVGRRSHVQLGLDVARALRKLQTYARVPNVAHTAPKHIVRLVATGAHVTCTRALVNALSTSSTDRERRNVPIVNRHALLRTTGRRAAHAIGAQVTASPALAQRGEERPRAGDTMPIAVRLAPVVVGRPPSKRVAPRWPRAVTRGTLSLPAR